MNIRQQKYKANRIAGMNCLNAAVAAGYSEKTARNGSNIRRLENTIKSDITDYLDRAGLTDKRISEELAYHALNRKGHNAMDALKYSSTIKGHVKSKGENAPSTFQQFFNIDPAKLDKNNRLNQFIKSNDEKSR